MVGFYNYTVLLTYLSVFISTVGIFNSISGNVRGAIICLMISGVCDMFDGKIASTRERNKNEMRFGVQVDSLCDLVCFGVLPVMICYPKGSRSYFFYFAASLYILAGVIRLAYYNVMEANHEGCPTAQSEKVFVGLPITTISLLLPLCYYINSMISTEKSVVDYSLLLIIVAVAFIVPIKIKKPRLKGTLALISTGILEFVFILLRG